MLTTRRSLLVVSITLFTISYASVLYVDTTGSDNGDCTSENTPCLSLRYALFTAAKPNDVISMSPGTYAGIGNARLDWPAPDTLYGIEIRGSEMGETVIDGEFEHYLFFIESCGRLFDEQHLEIISFSHITFTRAECVYDFPNITDNSTPPPVVEDNTTVLNNTMDGNTTMPNITLEEVPNQGGSVLFAREGCAFSFSDCKFVENACGENVTDDFSGSGILYIQDSSLSLTRVTFSENTIETEGGLGVVRMHNANIKMDNCLFDDNQVVGEGVVYGFGYIDMDVQDCTFTNNYAIKGSAINIVNDDTPSKFNMRNCSFVSNEGEAGVVFLENIADSVVEHCTFRYNVMDDGGLYIVNSDNIVIQECLFEHNNCTDGCGIYMGDNNTNYIITKSQFLNNYADRDAAGIFINDYNKNVLFRDVLIEGNYARDDGAGIFISDYNENITLEHSSFIKNEARDNGGGFYILERNRNVTLRHVLFKENVARDNGGGAWIYIRNNHTLLEHLDFIGNKAENGGGLYFINNIDFRVRFCHFEKNEATSRGAAINAATTRVTALDEEISDCTFLENSAGSGNGNDGNGGGIRADKPVTVSRCNFTRNTATQNGGAMSYGGSLGVIQDCYIEDNRAEIGGGMRIIGTNITVKGCHFNLNSQHALSGNSPVFMFNNTFKSSAPFDIEGFLPTGTYGNVFENIGVPPIGVWNNYEPLSLLGLIMVSGSVVIHPNSSFTITKSFSFSVEGTIIGYTSFDGNEQLDDTAEMVFTSGSESTLKLGDLVFENITIENNGHLSIEKATQLAFKPVNTYIRNDNGGVMSIENTIEISSDSSAIGFENATLEVGGEITINLPTFFYPESTIQMVLGTSFINWEVEPELNGTLRIEIPKTLAHKIGDSFSLMKFANETEIDVTTKFVDVFINSGETKKYGDLKMVDGTLVLIVSEKQRDIREWSRWDDTAVIIVLVLLAIGTICVFAISIFVIVYWKSSVVLRAATREFLLLILFGVLVSYAGAVAWIAPISASRCELRVWLPLMGFIIAIAPLVSKTYRIKRIFSMANVSRAFISFADLVQITLAAILIQLVSKERTFFFCFSFCTSTNTP